MRSPRLGDIRDGERVWIYGFKNLIRIPRSMVNQAIIGIETDGLALIAIT